MNDTYNRILVSFYEKHMEKHFTPCERDLFFYLLCTWAKFMQVTDKVTEKVTDKVTDKVTPFPCSTSLTERDLSMPRKTIVQCRRRLCERGLITFQEGKGKSNIPYYFFNGIADEVTDKVTEKVTVTKEEIPPTPPKEENNIYNNKETSSNEDVKKASLPSHTSDRMDWPAFMQTFNDMLSPGVPKVMSLSQSRRDKVKAIVKEFGKEAIMQAFEKIRKSDFLMGRNRKPNDNWKCNFDFIFSKSGFIKILEGNYDNEDNRTNYSEKRAVNEEVFRQFIAEREQRASGMVVEVEKPF